MLVVTAARFGSGGRRSADCRAGGCPAINHGGTGHAPAGPPRSPGSTSCSPSSGPAQQLADPAWLNPWEALDQVLAAYSATRTTQPLGVPIPAQVSARTPVWPCW